MSHVEDLDGMGIRIAADQLDIRIHDGYITVKNPETGDHRTLRVKTLIKKGDYFAGSRRVSLLTGSDNGSDYQDFGFITKAGKLVVYPSKRGKEGKRSSFEIFASMLAFPTKWEARGVEYRISGICRRCGRRLTVPHSIDQAFGPECARKIAA